MNDDFNLIGTGMHFVFHDAPRSVFVDPWTAVSRTRHDVEHERTYNYCMTYPAVTFIYCTALPVLWPVMAGLGTLHLFNTTRTVQVAGAGDPDKTRAARDVTPHTYVLYRRHFDEVLKRPCDVLLTSPAEISHAMQVVGKTRQQFIADPSNPTVEYFVMKQKTLEMTLTGNSPEVQMLKYLYDLAAGGLSILMALRFRSMARFMVEDLKLVRAGRLSFLSIRAPIFNFFRTPAEVQKDNMRVIMMGKGQPKAQPTKQPYPTMPKGHTKTMEERMWAQKK